MEELTLWPLILSQGEKSVYLWRKQAAAYHLFLKLLL